MSPRTSALSTKKQPTRAKKTASQPAKPRKSPTRKRKVAGKKKATPAVPLADQTTDQLWGLYRTEFSKVGRDGSAYLGELRNELMERHLPLVRYHAERLQQTLPKSIELDDLISAGQFGLMDAIRGFDPDRGFKFKTYCSTRIRGAILDQLRTQDWVPRLVRIKATKIERTYQRLVGEFGREPTHSELAQNLELDHGELAKEMDAAKAKSMFSLSEKWDDGDDGDSSEKMDVIEDRRAIDPIQELNRRDLMNYMTKSLTTKERFIIEQYYQYGHTMREIGEMLALTESRVCQIHSNVMGRLKSLLQQREESLSG